MSKSEENDVQQLAWALSYSEAKSFHSTLRAEKTTNESLNLKASFFSQIKKERQFDSEKFIKKHKLDRKQFNSIKHALFQDILQFLKINYEKYSDIALENKIVEFEILLANGLFLKASRKLKQIKKIAYEKCEFSVCIRVQRKAINYRLFDHDTNTNSLEQASNELIEFYKLSNNLNGYMQLSDEVLNFHFTCLDKRATSTEEILVYLEHELLKNEKLAISVLAQYYFFRIKSLIYLGSNDFETSKIYSLKALNYLSAKSSIYRNDLWHYIRCKNNFLEASLSLMETEPFEQLYPELQLISKKAVAINKRDLYAKALTFQFLCNLRLRYFWLIKDSVTFLDEFDGLNNLYEEHENLIWPSFKVEILLGFAKLKSLAGELNEANEFCSKILNEKTSTSSLYITCGNLLRLMVNFDRNNHELIPHLISTSTYALKKRDRLFEFERTFINGLNKIKHYHSEERKAIMFHELKMEMKRLLDSSVDIILDRNIRIFDWLEEKAEKGGLVD